MKSLESKVEIGLAPIKYSTLTLEEIDSLPILVYLTDKEGRCQFHNENVLIACQSASQSIVGMKAKQFYDAKTCLQIKEQDELVMHQQKLMVFESNALLKNDITQFQGISIKLPWYQDKKIIGILGFSMIEKKHSFSQNLEILLNLGLFSSLSMIQKNLYHDIYLTHREKQIIYYTLRGKSARFIGRMLFLSQRTVEYHLENLKIKFDANSKSELIEKVFHSGIHLNLEL